MKLLTFRPFIFDREKRNLFSVTNPEFAWPERQRVITTCPLGHEEPDEDHNCGVYSTLNFQLVKDFLEQKVDVSQPQFPIMGVVQALGKTVIDDNLECRSWGVYLWGLIAYPWMPHHAFIGLTRFHPHYTVDYDFYTQAFSDVQITAAGYGVKTNAYSLST